METAKHLKECYVNIDALGLLSGGLEVFRTQVNQDTIILDRTGFLGSYGQHLLCMGS